MRCFLSTATGWGIVTVIGERVEVEMIEGWLEVERLRVVRGEEARVVTWGARVEGRREGVGI
jgi:hypothetical protein